MKLLITGANGFLGKKLIKVLSIEHEVIGASSASTAPGLIKLDLRNPHNIRKTLLDIKPDALIHTAAITNIGYCENNKRQARLVNVEGTKRLACVCKAEKIKMFYISTDSVYDGIKGNYAEHDNINPQNYYGISKYEGELEVLKKEKSLILRTNIFGLNIQKKKSLGEWILESLKTNQKINGFKDAFFSSIYTMELARIIDISIQRHLRGVYNCGSADSCSKYKFGLKIADIFKLDSTLITPILIDDFNFKAKRGKDLSLNVDKLEKALNYKLPTIDQSVDGFYRDYKCGLPEEIKQQQIKSRQKSLTISYGRQWIDENDIQAVAEVLRTDWITQGPKVEEFEKALSEHCGTKYAVAVNSGTAALHIACLAAGIGSGDEVITSPNTFVASANCAAYCGARPVFVDIDADTYNISPKEIEKKIARRTKAIIPVHFTGQSCDMDVIQRITKIAEKKYGHKIYIIEDACHALGSLYKDKKVGSCAFSDMTVMSFHPVKHITTGEGGAVFTNDENLRKRLKRFRSHGITSDPKDFINKDLAFPLQNSKFKIQKLKNPWYYEQQDLGYNYRITDIQCALGLSQLEKLSIFRKRRREIVNIYNEAFSSVKNVQTPFESTECDSNFHLYVLLFDFEKIGVDRARFMLELKKKGIQTQVHYIPVHLQPFYQKNFGTKLGDCPNVEQYYQKCLSIPLYPAMVDQDVEKVIIEINNVIEGPI